MTGKDLIDQTNESMNEVFRSFKRELRNQKDIVRSNELELESQLQDMADSKVYQGMLEDIRADQRKEKRKAEDQKKEQAYARRSPYSREHIKIPAVSADVKINEAYFERAGISAEDAKAGYVPSPAPLVTEKPDVKVNLNSEYFRRKAALEAEKMAEQELPEEGVVSDVNVYKETDANAALEKNATDHSLSQNVTEQQPEPTAYENYTGGLETACTDSNEARKTAVSELRSLLSNMEVNAEPQYMGEAGADEEVTTGGTVGHMQDSSLEGTASADVETYGTLQKSVGKKDVQKQPNKDVNKTMEWEIAQEHLLNEENTDALQDIQTSRPSGSKKGTAGWKERMKVLLNEITPKDLDEK